MSSPPVAGCELTAVLPYPASLHLSLLAFHRSVGPIYKASQAKYGAFADLRTVLEVVTPALLEQGLVLSQAIAPAQLAGSCLVTTLTHAPSGEAISSQCLIPTLDQLLDRIHELRTTVLKGYPLDLQLAAVGALPPVLPPRPPAAQPAADGAMADADPTNGAKPLLPPPTPARPPGLRLDDQLRGLQALLSALGTTTNPLHGIGGAITYFRRYQILSLLCLAAEDNDGIEPEPRGTGASAASLSAPQATPQAAPEAAPANSRRRSTRRTTAPQAAPVPAPAPGPQAAEAPQATSTAAPQPAPTAAAAQQLASQAGSQPRRLAQDEIQELIASIRSIPNQFIPGLVSDFRAQFNLNEEVLISDYISTDAHATFLIDRINALRTPV